MERGASRTGALAVRRPRWARWWWLVAALLVVALVAWYVRNPAPLTVRGSGGEVSVPAGTDAYIGVATVGDGRSLLIRGVEVTGTGRGAELELLLCRDGRISITSSAESFCDLLLPVAEKALTLGSADQLVLRVSSDEPGTVRPQAVEVDFREGLQWGSQELHPGVEVTFLERG